MFGKDKKKKANPVSRFALGAFIAGASAYLLRKNKDEVKEGIDNVKDKAGKVKDKAERAKDDLYDSINSEEVK